MVQMRPSGTIVPVDQDEVNKQIALRDVMWHAVRERTAVTMARPIRSYRSRPIILAAIAVPAVILCAYALIAKPDFIYGPDPTAVPAVRREAYTRFAMFLLAQRLSGYRATARRLPESLEAAGENWEGITYKVLSDSVFELRARGDSGKQIVLRSDQRVDPFLGTSVSMIKRRPQ
jgi:hypothetical protein